METSHIKTIRRLHHIEVNHHELHFNSLANIYLTSHDVSHFFRMSRNTRRVIPDELHPSRKLTALQYTFVRPKSRPSTQSTPPETPSRASEEEQSEWSDTALNDPMGNFLREQLIDSHDFSGLEDEELDILLTHLKEYTKVVASTGDYEEARRSQSFYDDAFQSNYHRFHDRTRSISPRTRYIEARRVQEERFDYCAAFAVHFYD
jgi:hypothetical protein